MGFKLFPTEYYDSAYSINYEKYYSLGYKAIIFDIDNTLVPHDAPNDTRSRALFERLHNIGYKISFVSNNKEPRVKSFSDEAGGEYIFKAGKPKRSGFIEAMRRMQTTRENTLFIGDQIFTDIWGANRTGLHSILVKQVAKTEEIQIVLKRYLEKPILAVYQIKHKLKTK